MDNTIQVRLSDSLKKRLEMIAGHLEVPVSTLIRMVLVSFSRQPESVRLTPNGFTVEEEKRILGSINSTELAIKEKKAEVYRSMDEALKSLEKETKK